MIKVPYKEYGEWYIVKLSDIPKHALDIREKRFQNEHMLLTELFDYDSYNVHLFFENCRSTLDAINNVLVKIKYPLNWRGLPVDNVYYFAHSYFLLKFLVVKYNVLDFWKRASETIRDGYGDCEDTSTLMHSYFLKVGIDSFWVIGVVYENSKLLGGHAWVIGKLDNNYRLVETTLEQAVPSIDVFKVVDISKTMYNVGKLKYVAYLALHNLEELWFNKNLVHLSTEIRVDGDKLVLSDNIARIERKLVGRRFKISRKGLKTIKKYYLSNG